MPTEMQAPRSRGRPRAVAARSTNSMKRSGRGGANDLTKTGWVRPRFRGAPSVKLCAALRGGGIPALPIHFVIPERRTREPPRGPPRRSRGQCLLEPSINGEVVDEQEGSEIAQRHDLPAALVVVRSTFHNEFLWHWSGPRIDQDLGLMREVPASTGLISALIKRQSLPNPQAVSIFLFFSSL